MLLDLNGIQKRFGGVMALRGGNLSVEPGEVHLLLGENGAGKSTLMKIVAGMERRDTGRMLWQGRDAAFRTPAEAAAAGIAMVHQESLLAPHLSVAENIFLGREQKLPLGWVQRRRMVEQAARLVAEHHFPLHADWRVERLSPAGKQLVGICRAIQHGSSLLIFDEPTSSLSGDGDRRSLPHRAHAARAGHGRHLHHAPAGGTARHRRSGDHPARRRHRALRAAGGCFDRSHYPAHGGARAGVHLSAGVPSRRARSCCASKD